MAPRLPLLRGQRDTSSAARDAFDMSARCAVAIVRHEVQLVCGLPLQTASFGPMHCPNDEEQSQASQFANERSAPNDECVLDAPLTEAVA